LPQVEEMSSPVVLRVEELRGKKDWIILMHDKEGREIGGVWVGPDPELPGKPFDGFVRIGKSFSPAIIWSTFQRYSNGSYIRLPKQPDRVAGFKG